MQKPFDPGLQPERVSLSWQRSSVAIAVGALFYGRLVGDTLGIWALLPVVAGLALAILMGVKSHVRYRHHHRTLTSNRGHLADGLLLAVVSVSVACAGVFALMVMLLAQTWR